MFGYRDDQNQIGQRNIRRNEHANPTLDCGDVFPYFWLQKTIIDQKVCMNYKNKKLVGINAEEIAKRTSVTNKSYLNKRNKSKIVFTRRSRHSV